VACWMQTVRDKQLEVLGHNAETGCGVLSHGWQNGCNSICSDTLHVQDAISEKVVLHPSS
jgi:hypothetical protein